MPKKGEKMTEEMKQKMAEGRRIAREKRAKELDKVRQEVTKKKVILKQSEKDRRGIVKINKSAKIKQELAQLKKSMENYKKGNIEKEEAVEQLESVEISDLPEGFAGHVKKEEVEEQQEQLEIIKEESEDDDSLEELTDLYKKKINMLEEELHSERKNKSKVIEKKIKKDFDENDYNFYKSKIQTQKQVQVEKEFDEFIKTLDNQEHIKIVNESKSLYNHNDSFDTNMKYIKKHIKEQIKHLNDNKQAISLADKNKQKEQKFARKSQIQNNFSKLFKY